MQILGSTCTTFSASVSGSSLITPQYCLYDSTHTLVTCNSTGIFSNIPFGTYCATIANGCLDTTMQVCQTFNVARGINLIAAKSCSIGLSDITMQFSNTNAPYVVNVYKPDGTLVYNSTSSSNPLTVTLPGLDSTLQYKIVATNTCGLKDSAYIKPVISTINRYWYVEGKCPTGLFPNGAGDLQVSTTTNVSSVLPLIIKKNNQTFISNFTGMSGNAFIFSDLEPATYIIEYTLQSCNTKLYDTCVVEPYSYPALGQSTLYQCDNNGFSLSANVQHGVGPFTYQIIGSTPSVPSITTGIQSSPLFYINTGTNYSLVRLRAIDACGNASLADVSVLPLQNFVVDASSTCYFQNIVLSVDSMPNATFLWYRKTTPTDSVLVDSGSTYEIPYFAPELIGRYICKIIMNNGCLTRLTYIDLNGDCGNQTLASNIQLKGKAMPSGNNLTWTALDDRNVKRYFWNEERHRAAIQPLRKSLRCG
jgi:hypothetical protein